LEGLHKKIASWAAVLARYYFGGACGMYGGEERCIQGFGEET
jgi:hypothetical protein